ncbi:hypothetical protein [Amycolatopsis thermophila]|uniref:Uncharacterized protein n=1 Tax=Amycolatopsis thermophila TaxID=206084 RepID=A0ABU0EML2_9PSEU|nr:hypothetical protein [Amycolatopsis thermophila]MDQ0376511.1 hypothetical protein [Amycolatopsis thermophila]
MTAVHVLGSYFYLRKLDLTAELKKRPGVDFFADSGAFSAFTTGGSVDIDEYGDWLTQHAAVINCAATLDVIGDPVATARNTERLLARTGGRVTIMPAFHVGSPWPELHRLCAEHPYVALGGAVHLAKREMAMMRWLIKAHQIARDYNTRLHGFGLTRPPYPHILPWYSVDSSYWNSASRTGTLTLWNGRHFQTFRVGDRRAAQHANLIRAYGGNPTHVSTPGFALVREVGPRGSRDREWLNRATIESFRRYEAHVRGWRGTVPAPRSGSTTGDGLKVYLAAGNLADITLIRDTVLAKETTR